MFVETVFKKLEKFDGAYFKGKNYFKGDVTQNYLVFHSVYKYFERVGSKISLWKSKRLSNQKYSSITTSDGRVSKVVYDNARIEVKLNGDLLKLNKVTCHHGPIVNIYIVFRLIPTTKDSNVTLKNCLFGAVKLTKNVDIDNYALKAIKNLQRMSIIYFLSQNKLLLDNFLKKLNIFDGFNQKLTNL